MSSPKRKQKATKSPARRTDSQDFSHGSDDSADLFPESHNQKSKPSKPSNHSKPQNSKSNYKYQEAPSHHPTSNPNDLISKYETERKKGNKALQEQLAWEAKTPGQKFLTKHDASRDDGHVAKKAKRKANKKPKANIPQGLEADSSDEDQSDAANEIEFPDKESGQLLRLKFPQDIAALTSKPELIYLGKCL